MRMGKREKTDENSQSLTLLMRAAVEARSRLAQTREQLRSIEAKLRGMGRDDYEKQHSRALAQYIEAAGRARQARTRLLKTLKERTA